MDYSNLYNDYEKYGESMLELSQNTIKEQESKIVHYKQERKEQKQTLKIQRSTIRQIKKSMKLVQREETKIIKPVNPVNDDINYILANDLYTFEPIEGEMPIIDLNRLENNRLILLSMLNQEKNDYQATIEQIEYLDLQIGIANRMIRECKGHQRRINNRMGY